MTAGNRARLQQGQCPTIYIFFAARAVWWARAPHLISWFPERARTESRQCRWRARSRRHSIPRWRRAFVFCLLLYPLFSAAQSPVQWIRPFKMFNKHKSTALTREWMWCILYKSVTLQPYSSEFIVCYFIHFLFLLTFLSSSSFPD